MQALMLYDGLCILCTQSQRIVRSLDWLHRVERIDAQQGEVIASRFPELNDADLLGEIYVRRRDGTWEIGFFGMRYLATLLPLTWIVVPLLYLPGMNWLGPRVYRWIARRRYAINKALGQDCPGGVCKLDLSSPRKITSPPAGD